MMSIAFPWKRTTTSPLAQRMSSFVTRIVTRDRAIPVGSAFVLSSVRVLVWIRSGLASGAGRGFMETKSVAGPLEAPARRAGRHCIVVQRLHVDATRSNSLQGGAP